MSDSKKRRRAGGQDATFKMGGCLGFFLFGLFAGLGGLAFYFVSWQPISAIVAARSWESTTCEIVSSRVETSRSSDGDTYSIAVAYTYQVNGIERRGDRYYFGDFGSSSGYESKERIVEAMPPGSTVECWYDPDDPNASVIDRDPGWFLLWGLFPVPFLVVGLGGIFFLLFGKVRETRRARTPGAPMPNARTPSARTPSARTPSARTPTARPAVSPATREATTRHAALAVLAAATAIDASSLRLSADPSGRLALEPQSSRKSRVLGLALIAAFWNGFVVFALFQVGAFGGSGFDGCGIAFLVPFALVGVGLIVGFFHQLLALANPVPHLRLSTARPVPGMSLSLTWHLTGSVHRLDGFEIRLEGRELATYRRGTDTKTESRAFYNRVLVSTVPSSQRESVVEFEIPADLPPTFDAPNNKIEWRLKVHGDIPRWPDVGEDFALPVYPGDPDEIEELRR